MIDKPDASFSVNFNFGINKAYVEALDGTQERFFQSNWASTDLRDQDDFYVKVGGTLGDVYGYVSDGFYTVDDFSGYDAATKKYILKDGVVNSTSITGNTAIRPGFMKLKDTNGDGVAGNPTIDVNEANLTLGNIGGTLGVVKGGSGATTLTGYLKGNGTAAFTASATIPNTDISGLGTMSTQAASSEAITGGSIDGVTLDGGTF